MPCLVEPIYDSEAIEKSFMRVLYDARTLVLGSPYIMANPAHAAPASHCQFEYDDEKTDVINAYGGLRVDEKTHKYYPTIRFTRGIMCWLRVSALFASVLFMGGNTGKAKKMLRFQSARVDSILNSPGDVMNEMMVQFNLPTDGYFLDLSRRMFQMMVTCVLAHEAGHVCLWHSLRGQGADPGATNRNDERSADIFACSVLQSLGTGELGAVAFVCQMASLMFTSKKRENYDGMDSHPGTVERIRNIYTSFANVMKYSKVKWSDIEKIICR